MSSVAHITEVDFGLSSLTLKGLTNSQSLNTALQPRFIALHGWLDNAASFLPLLSNLEDVVAIDWPGHGHSDHRSGGAHYHFIDYVYDLLELYDINDWPALDIVAHSMGGMVAAMFASVFPEKVNSLTLIDSLGFLTDEEQNTSENLRKGFLSRLALAKKSKQQRSLNKIKCHANIDAGIKARLNVSDLKYGDAKLLVERGMQAKEQGFVWRSDPRLMTKSPLRLTLLQSQSILKAIKCPVQLIYGNKGMEMVKTALRENQSCFSDFKSTMLAGGHHVHMEQAKATAALIKYFVSENS